MRKTEVGSRWTGCRKAWLAAIAVAVGASGAASGQTIIHGPIQNPANGHWYGIMSPSGWRAARDSAAAYGGHLVTIENQAENDFVHIDLGIFFLTDGRLWLGLTDEDVEGTFVWIDGDPSPFRNWLGGEPNDNPPPEDWVEMHLSTGRWNDIAENPVFTLQGVVEFDEAVGACDLGGACSIMTPADCAAALGVYNGDFTLCSGACCLPDSFCINVPPPDCISQNGVYQGDGTNCGDIVCPDLSGACCLADGFCIQVIESICLGNPGATFRGVGTDCASACMPPANDTCVDAELLASLPATVSGSTEVATLDFEPQCSGTVASAPGVWYRFTGTGGLVTATLCGFDDPLGLASASYNAQISAYTDCGLLTCVAGNNDAGCGFATGGTIRFCAEPGVEYLIFVHGANGARGNFTLSVTNDPSIDCQPPANDLCVDAQPITLPALVSGDTTFATFDSAPTCQGFTNTAPGLWYRFVGSGREVTATTCPNVDPSGAATASFDTKISVYTDCGVLNCVAANDDFCTGNRSSVSFVADAGQEYLILVHAWALNLGTYSMAVFEAVQGACCLPDGSCQENIREANCIAMGGSFAGDGVACIDAACPNLHADDTPVPLAYNFNGIVHAAGGEQNQPDHMDGYRSISDRGLLFVNDQAPALPSAQFGYEFVETAFVRDIVFLGTRVFDTLVDGDNVGVQPNWMASNPITSSTTTVSPGIGVDETTRFGIIYHGSNGGASFDMTLGFSDGSSVTVRPTCPDWFANNNPAVGPAGPGIASQRLLAGPLSGGDGFDGAQSNDAALNGQPLNIVEAVVSRDSLLELLEVDIAGRTLTSVTFDNKVGGGLAIFAMSVDGTGGAACVCEADGNAAQVNVFDLLAYLDLWFAQAAGADIDGVAGVNVFDLLFFLDCWFPASAGAPCP